MTLCRINAVLSHLEVIKSGVKKLRASDLAKYNFSAEKLTFYRYIFNKKGDFNVLERLFFLCECVNIHCMYMKNSKMLYFSFIVLIYFYKNWLILPSTGCNITVGDFISLVHI